MYFVLKIVISGLVIAAVSELAKRYSAFAAIVGSLPMTSILAMMWLYRDTKDAAKVANLSVGIFWAVLPSMLFFITLPLLLRAGWKFGWAMTASCVVMFAAYSIYVLILDKFGVKI